MMPLSPPTPRDLQVTWLPTRPDLVIQCLHGKGTSTSRGYHESYFEVVSRKQLNADDFKSLDACGLLGMGQAYQITKTEPFTDTVPAVSIDRRTGAVLPDMLPMNAYTGQQITSMHEYGYWRYHVRRICDSGD